MKLIFSLIVTTVLLFSITINEQIHALENASPQKRVELMNHIKEQLISMNNEKRMKTIGVLQKKLQSKQMQMKNRHQAESSNHNGHEPTHGSRPEKCEMQEHMMNPSRSQNVKRHQSSQNHRSRSELEERNGGARNNQNNFRR